MDELNSRVDVSNEDQIVMDPNKPDKHFTKKERT